MKVRFLWNGRPYANKDSARVAQWHTFNREKWYAARDRSEKKYPERKKARHAVQNKVHLGFMLPARMLICFDCKGPADIYDHYLGYKWKYRFAVQAVCRKCDAKRRWGKRKR